MCSLLKHLKLSLFFSIYLSYTLIQKYTRTLTQRHWWQAHLVQRKNNECSSTTGIHYHGYKLGVDGAEVAVPGHLGNPDVIIALVCLYRLAEDMAKFTGPNHPWGHGDLEVKEDWLAFEVWITGHLLGVYLRTLARYLGIKQPLLTPRCESTDWVLHLHELLELSKMHLSISFSLSLSLIIHMQTQWGFAL